MLVGSLFETKLRTPVMPITPLSRPFCELLVGFATRMIRLSARQFECVMSTGAFEISNASSVVLSPAMRRVHRHAHFVHSLDDRHAEIADSLVVPLGAAVAIRFGCCT